MRTDNALKNISISIVSQIIIVALGFVSRKVFLDNLGIDYLGINGLLTNVLSIMALVESGIGISIVYNLYKPLAEDDRNKIIALVQLYKKAYAILSLFMILISICLYPLIGILMKDGSSISNITLIYFLFVTKNIVSYLNAHKWSLINADQKGYVLARVDLLFQVVTTIVKIIVLISTKSFIIYLILELILYVFQSFINGRVVNKRYPYIKTKEKYTVSSETKENLIKNVKAMFLHNIGAFLVFGTDNILISTFIGLATVGIYSNYTMIINQLSALIKPILGGVAASVGNLIATESSEKNYSIFKVTYLVNFWIYSLGVIFLYNLLEPFISWWLGRKYLLDNITFIFILVNFYLTGMRTAISTFKNKAGLFVQDKYAPIAEGLINLIASLVLVKIFGLAGIFMGTVISTIATVFWTQPVIVYKNIFRESVGTYFKNYIFFSILTCATCFFTSKICNSLVFEDPFLGLVFKGCICLILPNIIYFLLFFKTQEFHYLINVIKGHLVSFKRKKKQIMKGA